MIEETHPIAIVGVYSNCLEAENTVRLLEQAGVAFNAISVIGRDQQAAEAVSGGFKPPASVEHDEQVQGTIAGAGMGGVFGLLIGVGSIFVPGLGLAFVLGPLAGALVGSVWGWLLGGLAYGDSASAYRSHLIAGHFLVVAHLTSEQETVARAAMQSAGPIHLETHSFL